MKILFIGGTGVISSACSELAVSRGIELYHLNRGKSIGLRNIEGVQTIISDIIVRPNCSCWSMRLTLGEP